MSSGNKDVKAWRDNYLLLPYCRQITECYKHTWHTKPKKQKGRRIKLPANDVALVTAHLQTIISAILEQTPFAYVPQPAGSGYPSKVFCKLSKVAYSKHYSITPNYSFLPKLLKSLDKTIWKGNLWGSTLLRHFPTTHPTYQRYLNLVQLQQALENTSESSDDESKDPPVRQYRSQRLHEKQVKKENLQKKQLTILKSRIKSY